MYITNRKTEKSSLVGLIHYFRILTGLIILILLCFSELCFKSKLEGSERNASSFQFRYCENNIETSTLFQNDPPSFVSSSKISVHSSVTLSNTIESITNGSGG